MTATPPEQFAATGADGERLAQVAAAVGAARRPGIVSVLGHDVDGGEVRVSAARPTGRPLSAASGPEAVAAVAAAMLATLADLHHLGVAHGRIDADSVRLDPNGHPVLPFPRWDAPVDPAADVIAVAQLALELVRPAPAADADPIAVLRASADGQRRRRDPAEALTRVLRGVLDGDPTHTPPAGVLARDVRRAVPALRLPALAAGTLAPRPGAPARERRGVPRRRALAGGVAAIAGITLAGLASTGRVGVPTGERPVAAAQPAPPPSRQPAPAPTTTTVPGPACRTEPCPEVVGAVVVVGDRRYAVGDDGDRVRLADLDCDGTPEPLVWRPGSGEVFVFDRWADRGVDVVVPASASIPDARDLRVVHGAGCDRLEAVGPDGRRRPVVLATP